MSELVRGRPSGIASAAFWFRGQRFHPRRGNRAWLESFVAGLGTLSPRVIGGRDAERDQTVCSVASRDVGSDSAESGAWRIRDRSWRIRDRYADGGNGSRTAVAAMSTRRGRRGRTAMPSHRGAKESPRVRSPASSSAPESARMLWLVRPAIGPAIRSPLFRIVSSTSPSTVLPSRIERRRPGFCTLRAVIVGCASSHSP